MINHLHLLGQYISIESMQASAKITGVDNTRVYAILNYEEWANWENTWDKKTKIPSPPLDHYDVQLSELDEKLVFPTPQYHNKTLAFPTRSGIIHTPLETKRFIPPLRRGSTEENIMARTAVFDSENVLIKVYASGKEAKAAHKGATDLKFVAEPKKDEPFATIGEYETADQLFPPIVKPEKAKPEPKADGETKTRTVVKRTGEYTIVKADGARFGEGDERGLLHSALMDSDTVEEYLEKAPKEAKFTSSRGAEQSVTASGYMAYAVKRAWIKFPSVDDTSNNPPVEDAQPGE